MRKQKVAETIEAGNPHLLQSAKVESFLSSLLLSCFLLTCLFAFFSRASASSSLPTTLLAVTSAGTWHGMARHSKPCCTELSRSKAHIRSWPVVCVHKIFIANTPPLPETRASYWLQVTSPHKNLLLRVSSLQSDDDEIGPYIEIRGTHRIWAYQVIADMGVS